MYNNQFNNYNNQFPIINIIEAIQIALNNVYGQVIKAELDRENGFLIYEVEIIDPQGRRYEIEIDAYNGNILDIKSDS